jgi:hypothetical protein
VCTSFALVITNIKNNIPFVLEMEKDHYTMWAELFEVHACARKVIDHIIPQPEKEKFVEKILWIVQEAKSTPTKFIGCLWEIPLGTLKRNC